ncbi:uncharacterized protein LOC122067313 [Macadamia integrifolia]|uniref:uncharacterized protein LOC122067313 n=1 Tax=Macadamia integrifolia TaxID=60698 RepID=UPI001C4F2666|nr:uncharacterized protein LOC122067313 [Macadamia integrifolia]XP_042487078.1 uncharacterized protein LOC122067313 [Macadamia integrifolia]XP_042487079.1 uncharacterized protein LOC122067313 [Macadamia integrifolia]
MSEQDNDEIFGNNSPDDTCWLYSLSDSELDFLISLKMLAIHRAKVIGHEDLADKFDLKMLRALGLVLTEYLNGCCENTSAISFLIDSSTLLDGSNLLMNLKDSFASVKSEDIRELIDTQSKKKNSRKSSRRNSSWSYEEMEN